MAIVILTGEPGDHRSVTFLVKREGCVFLVEKKIEPSRFNTGWECYLRSSGEEEFHLSFANQSPVSQEEAEKWLRG